MSHDSKMFYTENNPGPVYWSAAYDVEGYQDLNCVRYTVHRIPGKPSLIIKFALWLLRKRKEAARVASAEAVDDGLRLSMEFTSDILEAQ